MGVSPPLLPRWLRLPRRDRPCHQQLHTASGPRMRRPDCACGQARHWSRPLGDSTLLGTTLYILWPGPGGGFVAMEFVHRLDAVARNDVLGHLYRFAVPRGSADANDLQHGQRHGNLQFAGFPLRRPAGSVKFHPRQRPVARFLDPVQPVPWASRLASDAGNVSNPRMYPRVVDLERRLGLWAGDPMPKQDVAAHRNLQQPSKPWVVQFPGPWGRRDVMLPALLP